MFSKGRIVQIVSLLLSAFFLSGCFWNDDVATDQMGVVVDGGAVKECKTPGVYNDMSFYADLVEISMSTLTINVEDPQVATKDNQLVSMKVVVQARRLGDCAALTNLLTNWSSLVTDEGLIALVGQTTNEALKNGTRDFTLTELLNDRNGLAEKIKNALQEDATNYSTNIVNVLVSDVGLDAEYAAELQKKALMTAQTETELRRQELIRQQSANDQLQQQQTTLILAEQLKAEQAQTAIDVEIARRAGEVVAAENSTYSTNPQAFELKKLELTAKILGDKQVVYFLPQGTNLSLLLGQSATTNIVPVPTTTP